MSIRRGRDNVIFRLVCVSRSPLFPDDEYAFERAHRSRSHLRYVIARAVTSDTRYAIVAHSVTARSALMVVIQRQLERYYRSVEST